VIFVKRALTDAAVNRIKPPSSGQADHFDIGYPGLALRVSYGGTRAWVFFFRLHGKLHRMSLGRYPATTLGEARDAWRKARTLVSKGENPIQARPVAADTFAAVYADWLKRDQGKNRSVDQVRRAMDHNVLPVLGDRLITDIRRRDVIELIDAITDRGAVSVARRVHAHLHRLFRWSAGREIVEINPMTDLPKPGPAVRRERVLTDDELAKVWTAAGGVGWPFGPITKLLILTGARREEISAMRWSEIHGDKIELSGARTKNGEPFMIPLTMPSMDIVSGLPRIGRGHVFTTTGESAVSGWSVAKQRLDSHAQIPDWRIHDFRRTVATNLQKLGVGLQVIEAVLGHISGSRSGVVGIYQRHSFDTEKRAALELWAKHVEQIVRER
jgi:integrase